MPLKMAGSMPLHMPQISHFPPLSAAGSRVMRSVAGPVTRSSSYLRIAAAIVRSMMFMR